MAYKHKPDHVLRDPDNVEYPLYITTDYEFSYNGVIIINEAATGDGGVSYHNGRTQESVPLNGVLFGDSREHVNELKNKLFKLANSGVVVEFNSPYSSDIRSNKYFIANVKFGIIGGKDNQLPFSFTLSEYRESNVKKVSVNLVNFETAELYNELYLERIGGSS